MAEKEILVVTSPEIPGKKIVRTVGLVSGNTIRARHVGKDIMAGLRNLVGGEVTEYGKLLSESREQALDRMKAKAENLGPTPSSAFNSRLPSSWVALPK